MGGPWRRVKLPWTRIAAAGSAGLGLLLAGAGAVHAVGVWNTAFRERGGYDIRLGTLLAIGWTLAVAGGILAASSAWTWRGRRGGVVVGLCACAFVLGLFAFLFFIAGWTGIALASGQLVLLGLAWRDVRADA
jgi:hypothetical protein